MEDDEAESLSKLEIPRMTESDKIKLRLRNFCYVIGFLLILWIISIIIIAVSNKVEDKDPWEIAYKKAQKFISNLNSKEIIGLLNGINNINETSQKDLCEGQISSFNNNNVNFKGMCLQDGTTGVRFSNGTGILWQSEINTAATFNKTLIYEIGKAQGEESKERGINTLLSPCVNIMGRSEDILWESFGENPFYSGVCASEIIKGIQESNVIATIKHFLGNEQEIYEILNSSNTNKNAILDDYFELFYRAIHDAQVGAVMVSNNALNKSYYNENEYLLSTILKGSLNFKGFVLSDLLDIYNNHSYNFSLLDLNMVKECVQESSKENDSNGRNYSCFIPSEKYMRDKNSDEKRFKESATRIIASMYKMNQMENYPEVDLYKEVENENRTKIQREAATESQILLKNDNILPLENNTKIVVIGNIFMGRDCIIDGKLKYINEVNGDIQLKNDYINENEKFKCFISPLNEIEELAKEKDIEVISPINAVYQNESYWEKIINENNKNKLENLINNFHSEILPKIYIVFLIATSRNKYSIIERTKENKLLLLEKPKELIKYIAKCANENVIVVINSPSDFNLPWINKVKAILFSGFPGEEASHAIADILFGKANPSGHLPFTWKIQYYKEPSFSNELKEIDNKTVITRNDKYRYNLLDRTELKSDSDNFDMKQSSNPEGLYIGQRWFNKYNKKFKEYYTFPFGYGLSYSSFNYSNFNLSISENGLTVKFNVSNSGNYTGQAVPMMFLIFPDNTGDYPKFKGFNKVKLKPNETQRITIYADDHALSYFNVTQNKYVRVNEGNIEVYIVENGNISDPIFNDSIKADYKGC